MLDHDALENREKIFRYNLFEDKIIQNCFKIDATH